jgi:hypothetical protein
VGIGTDRRAEADYYMFENSELNTFSKEQNEGLHKRYPNLYREPKVVKMLLVPINDVIAEHFRNGRLDLLAIDTEGLDLGILKSLDFSRCQPQVICVETNAGVSDEETAIFSLMRARGYQLWGRTSINAIFVLSRDANSPAKP